MVERVPGQERPPLADEQSSLFKDFLRYSTCLGSFKQEILNLYDPLAEGDGKVVTSSFEVNEAPTEEEAKSNRISDSNCG